MAQRWDEYILSICRIKCTIHDSTLTNKITPFGLLFGRKPCISLDTFVPQIDDMDRTQELENFVESRRQNFKEIYFTLEKRHRIKAKSRQKANNRNLRKSARTLSSNWQTKIGQ